MLDIPRSKAASGAGTAEGHQAEAGGGPPELPDGPEQGAPGEGTGPGWGSPPPPGQGPSVLLALAAQEKGSRGGPGPRDSPRRGRGLALCEAPKGSVGLETAPHTHLMGPLAACLSGRSRGHRERGGGGRCEPLTQAGGAQALLTSGKPRRSRQPPGAPIPPPGARLTVLVLVLQAWPSLSPQGAGPPAGEGVAPALIPL